MTHPTPYPSNNTNRKDNGVHNEIIARGGKIMNSAVFKTVSTKANFVATKIWMSHVAVSVCLFKVTLFLFLDMIFYTLYTTMTRFQNKYNKSDVLKNFGITD